MQGLPQRKTLEDVDLKSIVDTFETPSGGRYHLPRMAFIGLFRHLSMTSQRHVCKHVGFEYYPNIEMATSDQSEMSVLTTKWNGITKKFTKLIVLGECYDRMPGWELEYLLSKKYKGDDFPAFQEYKIPTIMESELWRLHRDYPNIGNNTVWEDKDLIIQIHKDAKLPIRDPLFAKLKKTNESLHFGYNCKYLAPQKGKCERIAKARLNDHTLTDTLWVDLNRAVLYSNLLGFDLLEEVETKNIPLKLRGAKKDGKAVMFKIEAAYNFDECYLTNDGGSCIHFEPHDGKKIGYLMEDHSIENHPNYDKYETTDNEREGIRVRALDLLNRRTDP
jgi:hypothetical protein